MKKLFILAFMLFGFSLFSNGSGSVRLIDPVNFSDDNVVNVISSCEKKIYFVPGPYQSMNNLNDVFEKLGYRNISSSSSQGQVK